jgi:hypothetical protein
MAQARVKIRGIYATALTRLLLDLGYEIVQPSQEIQDRFHIPESEAQEGISILDRDDRQGVLIDSEKHTVEDLIPSLWEVLVDMVVREIQDPEIFHRAPKEEPVCFDIEFPGASKARLDGLRARVVPTLLHHHRLRIIASDHLDLIESQIERKPHTKNRLERELMRRLVFQPLEKGNLIRIDHVKPEGETLKLRGSEILSAEPERLFMKRLFHTGRYDGLDLPIEPGDYSITEVPLGGWWVKHTYFTEEGALKGQYWNVNTPVELYPDRIRYVDLHVDVIRRVDQPPQIIDKEELESAATKGLISPRLCQKALDVAQELVNALGSAPVPSEFRS